ncbi:MAG: MATE family efflux transporter [Halioglobus sp.]
MQVLTRLDHKILGIAWPAILSNLSIPLLGLVDAAILGHLGSTDFLAAVAIGSAILSFLYWGFGFLRMGTTGLVAKAAGAGKEADSIVILSQSVVLALVLAALVMALHPLWLGLGFSLMAPQEHLLPIAQSYAGIRIVSAPAVLTTYAIVGWFIGHQNTRWPMAIVITTNLANIGLDFLLIIGLGMASDGAAIATVIAEYLGLLIGVIAIVRSMKAAPSIDQLQVLRSLRAYRTLLASNANLFVRTLCLLASFAFFTAMGDKLGSDTLAANALLLHLMMLAAYGLDGFAFAAEGLTGNALGAKNLGNFYSAVHRCAIWCAVTAAAISIVFALSSSLVFPLLTDLPQVRAEMAAVALWLILLPIIAAPSYLLDGVFIGSAETRPMMITMLVSTLAVYLPAWYLTQSWGNHGLWFAFTAFNGARGLTLWIAYRHKTQAGSWLGAASNAH